MIILVNGSSHTGKTYFSSLLMEKYLYPYYSIDLLKMGLIRSRNTKLTPYDDTALTEYLWPIIKEIILTALENNQNLIIEGSYIPLDYKKYFPPALLNQIRCITLIFSKQYIETNFEKIISYASRIEKRKFNDEISLTSLIKENLEILDISIKEGNEYLLIDEDFNKTINCYINSLSERA